MESFSERIRSYQDPKKTAGLLQSRDALWLLQSLWWPTMVSEGQALFRASWLIGTAVMTCTICTMNRWRALREVRSKQDGGFQSWSVVFRPTPLKNDGVSNSWDDFSQYMENKHDCKPPTSILLSKPRCPLRMFSNVQKACIPCPQDKFVAKSQK